MLKSSKLSEIKYKILAFFTKMYIKIKEKISRSGGKKGRFEMMAPESLIKGFFTS